MWCTWPSAAHSFSSWARLHCLPLFGARLSEPGMEASESRVSGSQPPARSPDPGRAADKRPSLLESEAGGYLWGRLGAGRFAETNKMAACLQVVRAPALAIASETAEGPSPAPSFCFQNGMELSASSHRVSASMQMMNSGVSQGVNPLRSDSRAGK